MKIRLFAIFLAMLVLTGCAFSAPAETTVPVTTAAPVTETTQPPTETTAPPETTEPPVMETARATISATGDLLMHKALMNKAANGNGYNFDPFFDYIYAYVNDADFAVANLETTLAGTAYPYSGFPQFNCPDSIVDSVRDAGFDMLLTANNHSNDTGKLGMTRTMQVITDAGIVHLGTVQNPEDPNYLVRDISGIKVGMICYTYGQISSESGQKSVNGLPISKDLTEQINVFDYNKLDRFYAEMETQLAAMEAEGAEAFVLFIHWGNEYELKQNSYQTAIAQKMCDLGIDVIIGGHPHVIQPVEMLTSTLDPSHQTFCVYSTGNTLSNQRAANMRLDTGHTEDGMLASVTFVKYSNGVVALESAEILPTWLNIYDGSYEILPLDSNLSDWKSAFGLSDWYYDLACASYDRTMALIGEGMEQVTSVLAENKRNRELEMDISFG